ncbi:MAG: HTH-type transcriptional repressor PurR [Phycisphaerae bacterium]|nr:HTH-type transcriptional repressor PurR [Phycisphaerae bacterium]
MARKRKTGASASDDLTPEQAASLLRSRLRFYLPGSKLPGRAALAEQLGVSTYVSRRAVELLAEQGLLKLSSPGGAFVTPKAAAVEAIRAIHILASAMPNQHFHEQEFLLGAKQACLAGGLRFRVTELAGRAITPDLPDQLAAGEDPLQTGWALLDRAPPDSTLRSWQARGVPAVLVNAEAGVETHTIRTSGREAIHLATERLILLGHRRIAFAGAEPGFSPIAQLRYEGFELAIGRHGLADSCESVLWDGRRQSREKIRGLLADLLARPDRPTALVVDNQLNGCDALAVCDAMGLKIPAHVSVISGGIGRRVIPPMVERLTRYDEGTSEEQSHMVVEFFANYFNHRQPVHLLQGTKFVDAGSIGPPDGA